MLTCAPGRVALFAMGNVNISELLKKRRWPLLSFEFFPPKDDDGLKALVKAAEQLRAAKPDFVTVTYGAGGSTRERTFQVCRILHDMGFAPVMPHLTCVGSSQAELHAVIDSIHHDGYRNIMALRGDPPKGETVFTPAKDGLSYASELVALIRQQHPDIGCGVAGYPEMHPEATSAEDDIRHLADKVRAGADFVTTQLFFDNKLYFNFVERCRKAGIHQPILPGLLPAISVKQVQRMTSRCKAALPPTLLQRMEAAGAEGPKAEEVGIAWAVDQIEELLRYGVPGIHLYVLNRSKVALSPALLDCFLRRRRVTPDAAGFK
jgi:methylenetetrahydrofolate reductase (NADPH)